MAALLVAGAVTRVSVAADESAAPRLGGSPGVAGIGPHRPGNWGLVQSRVRNPAEHAQRARVIFFFDRDADRQFVREVWLPARSQRRVRLPVRLGPMLRPGRTVPTTAVLMPPGREQAWDRKTGAALVETERVVFVSLLSGSSGDVEADRADDAVTEALEAVRRAVGLDPRVMFVADRQAPRFAAAWDQAAVVAVAGADLQLDAAQAVSLRRWVRSGGTLLVFADRTEESVMQAVLGAGAVPTVVDSVSLEAFKFAADGRHAGGASAASTLRFERPVRMARVMAPGFETHLRVRGWPALLSRAEGGGRVVISCLGGRAWTQTQSGRALAVLQALLVSPEQLGPAGLVEGATDILETQEVAEALAGQLGYRVMSRRKVGAVLGGFAAILAVMGLFFQRRGLADWFPVVAVVATLLASTLLLTVGLRQRGRMTEAMAAFQMIEAHAGEGAARVEAALGLFSPEGGRVSLSGRGGGAAWLPQTQGRLGPAVGVHRTDWLDVEAWDWPQLQLAAGAVQPVRFASEVPTDRPLGLTLGFGADGLVGELHPPVDAAPLSGLVLVAEQAKLQVHAQPAGGRSLLRVGPADVLPRGVFFRAGVLSEAQRRRRGVLSRLLYPPSPAHPGQALYRSPFGGPLLLGWSAPLETGLRAGDLQVRGEALWTLHPAFLPATPGSAVRVPWPLVGMEPMARAAGDLGLNLLPLYGMDGRWLRVANPSAFVGRFTLPAAVRPLRITAARCHLDIAAIGRPVRV
ncbi:MAG: hypothetical protein OER86_06360, partial [Phycisphaerae bacterium]|nr:hypothetical protein [Phycisphaerae bacterium]